MKVAKETSLTNKIIGSLKKDAVELIDFDEIQKLLTGRLEIEKRLVEVRAELDYIKGEYRARMIGMLKAIMVGRREEGDVEILSRLSDNIDQVDASEMVKMYSQVASRFRARFPASFRYLKTPSAVAKKRNWEEHKI